MLQAARDWIGLGLGSLLAVGSVIATIEFLGDSPRDWGQIAFNIVFGIFWAGVAVGSGYGLLDNRGRAVSGGCLTIAAVVGGLVVLSACFLALASAAGAESADRLVVAIIFGGGAVLLIPSALLLWRRRDPSPEAASMRHWEGVVVGVIIAFLAAVLFVATLGEPYDVGPVGHVAIAVAILTGVVVTGISSLLIRRAPHGAGSGRTLRS